MGTAVIVTQCDMPVTQCFVSFHQLSNLTPLLTQVPMNMLSHQIRVLFEQMANGGRANSCRQSPHWLIYRGSSWGLTFGAMSS